MRITKVHYKKLFSLGNFENESIGAEAEVSEDRLPEKVLADLQTWVESQHARNIDQLNRAYDMENQIANHKRELAETTARLEVVRERWAKAKAFLSKHGIDPEDLDMPF